MVSTLIYVFFSSASFALRGQSQIEVLHFLQITPPTILVNYGPSIDIPSGLIFKIPI